LDRKARKDILGVKEEIHKKTVLVVLDLDKKNENGS